MVILLEFGHRNRNEKPLQTFQLLVLKIIGISDSKVEIRNFMWSFNKAAHDSFEDCMQVPHP